MNLSFKQKIFLWTLGLALGIPTSYNGLVWFQAKVLVQQVNCIEDVYRADYTSEAAIKAAEQAFHSCQDNVTIKKGTLELVEEQRRRAVH